MIKTALVNILDNAVKYGNNKDINISLSFGKQIVINIEDHGLGIEGKEIDLIFEPFYRASSSGKIKGSGIGLSLVKSIFNLHEIKLDVQSQKNLGSVFTIIFPEQSN